MRNPGIVPLHERALPGKRAKRRSRNGSHHYDTGNGRSSRYGLNTVQPLGTHQPPLGSRRHRRLSKS
jgi:hypothetical protein